MYWTSVAELRGDDYWALPSSEHGTLAAAQAAVRAQIPADERRFNFSAAVNEWNATRTRVARSWTFDTASRTFLEPRDVPPAEGADRG